MIIDIIQESNDAAVFCSLCSFNSETPVFHVNIVHFVASTEIPEVKLKHQCGPLVAAGAHYNTIWPIKDYLARFGTR